MVGVDPKGREEVREGGDREQHSPPLTPPRVATGQDQTKDHGHQGQPELTSRP
jgi:hypothetical protein